MARAILLTCPVCDATLAIPGDRDDHARPALLEAAADHLAAHDLRESALAIRKHEIASTAQERLLPADDLDDLPTDRWAVPAPA